MAASVVYSAIFGVASGVQCVILLALSDQGAPAFNTNLAGQLAAIGVPAFACTPDRFPDLMAAAIARQPLMGWADNVVK